MSSHKGFATAFFAAFAVFALALLVSTVLVSDSGFENYQLESRIARERFEDARDLANWTQEDAIVDAAFAHACNSADFCVDYSNRVSSYWSESRGVLNDSVVNVSFAGVPSCSRNQVTPQLLTFSVGFADRLFVSSKNTAKNASFSFAKTGSVAATPGGQNVVVTIDGTGTSFSYDCPPGGGDDDE